MDEAGNLHLLTGASTTEQVYTGRSSSSNAQRTDRVSGTAYQMPDPTRPGSVLVNYTLSVASGQTGAMALLVGTQTEMVEQARREVGVISEGMISGIVGAILSLVVQVNEKGSLRADVPAGGWYKVVAEKAGSEVTGKKVTASINWVKERTF